MRITVKISIKASQQEVFALFSDFKNIQNNISSISDFTILSNKSPNEIGFRWKETRIVFGKEATEEMWLSAIVPPNSYVIEAKSHGMHYKSEYNFTSNNDNSTTVNLTFTGTPLTLSTKLFSPLLSIIFKNATKKAFLLDMTQLKNKLERAER